MGVFDDKKYDELDWVSQAVEPIDSHLNTILGQLPDEIVIDFEHYVHYAKDSYNGTLETSNVVSKVLARQGTFLSWQESDTLTKCFDLVTDGNELIINFETKTIEGGLLKMVKIVNTIDDKILENLMGQEGVDQVSYQRFDSPEQMARANEIMEYLGKSEEGIRSRSYQKKRVVLIKRLKEIFKTNEWKIKDMTLANKVGHWIKDYITDGNLAALSNFCRLKVMTHKDQAIYSMEEIK